MNRNVMTMWRRFFTPEILFLFGTLQALFPYVLWYFLGSNTSYHYEITYLPVVIWTVGYGFFWLGTKVIRINPAAHSKPFINLSLSSTKLATICAIGLVIVQVIQAVRLYGVLPFYGYLTGSFNVIEMNEIQRESGFGQLGSLTVTLFFLNGILLILFIKSLEARNRPRLLLCLAACIEIFGSLVSGKRQGLLIFITFLLCGLSIQFNNPLKPVLKFFALPANRIIRVIIYSSTIGFLLFLIGFVSSIRMGTGSDVSGIDEILNYLQYPLINLEAQCEEIGLGPYKYNFLYPLLTLLPFKLYETIAPPFNELPFRPEPTIGAGFYGSIHWGLGIFGIILYAFIFGLISKFFYKKSSTNLFHLLVYCQISWTLLSAHTYNHFFTLIFLPVPTILFFIFCFFFNRTSSHQEIAVHETNQSLPIKQ